MLSCPNLPGDSPLAVPMAGPSEADVRGQSLGRSGWMAGGKEKSASGLLAWGGFICLCDQITDA
jgi:hypothetical protein